MQLVEEKEIARNAFCISRSNIGAMSSYRKYMNNVTKENTAATKKRSLKDKCLVCNQEINLYIQYHSGKLNKDAFKTCVKCFKNEKGKKSAAESENSAITNFIESLTDDRSAR